MRERAVRARRELLGARRRTCQIASFTLRVTKHGLSGSLAVRHFFCSEPSPLPWFSRITRHETRITAFYRVLRPSGGEKCRLASGVADLACHPRQGTSARIGPPPLVCLWQDSKVPPRRGVPDSCDADGLRSIEIDRIALFLTDMMVIPLQSVVEVPWKARRAPAHPRRGVRRSSEPGDLLRRTTKPTALGGRLRVQARQQDRNRRWNKKMSVARRVTRRFCSAARRARRHVPEAAGQ